MKKKHILAGLPVLALLSLAAIDKITTNSIFMLETTDAEIKIGVRSSPSQTAPFLEFNKGPTNVFGVNSNGLIYGSGGGFTSGVTTNQKFLSATGTTNTLLITNGIIWGVN